MAIFLPLIKAAQSKNIELAALLLRQFSGFGRNFDQLLSLEAAFQTLEVKTKYVDLFEDAVLCAKDEKGQVNITLLLNKNLKGKEAHPHVRFLLAHTLGHVILHIHPPMSEGNWRTSGLKEPVRPHLRYIGEQGRMSSSAMEYEADQFAASLLLPQKMLELMRERGESLDSFAQRVRVSPEIIEKRMQDLWPKAGHKKTPSFSTSDSTHPLAKIRKLAQKIDRLVE